MRQIERLILSSTAIVLVLCISASAADWTNSGGNSSHDCLSTEVGPQSASVLWSGSRPSIKAWQPVTEGDRVYVVRQLDFPPSGEPYGSPIVCQDLTTGVEEWTLDVPYIPGTDWTTWIAGVSQGRLYASRSSDTPSMPSNLRCYDSATGAPLWISTDVIDAGGYDAVVFAPNGDPVIGSRTMIWRINHLTGSTVWSVSRYTGSSSSGVAISGNAVYGTDFPFGALGTTIRRYDLATGAYLYESGPMGGGNSNSPMVGPDGTIYQHGGGGPSSYFFYAWTDTGFAIVPKWNVPSASCLFTEGGVGPDGSIYHLAPNNEIHRLDPATGATISTSAPLPVDANSSMFPRFAIDSQGKVFATNGQWQTGILASFNADLTLRWSIPWPSAKLGGPAIGQNGTLVMAGIDTNLVAYRDNGALPAFCFGDGSGTACPCSNSGATGHGCQNSIGPVGGLLQGSGNTSVSADTVVLSASGLPNATTLFFQGTSQTGGGPGVAFGDGLRCAGGTIVRLGTKFNVAGASQYPTGTDPSISVRGQVPAAGGVRTYQAWYRNATAFCTPSTFNLTNGLEVTWVP